MRGHTVGNVTMPTEASDCALTWAFERRPIQIYIPRNIREGLLAHRQPANKPVYAH